MINEKDDADRAVDLLIEYQRELAAEMPVLNRYTDVIPRPDHLGGDAERDRDRAWRRCLMCPKDVTAADACIDSLTRFKETQTRLADVQDALCMIGQAGLADALARRRTRRDADIDRMIKAAENLKDAIRKADEQAAAFADSVGADYDIIKSLKDALTEPPTFDVVPDGQHVQPTETSIIDYRRWEDTAVIFNRGIAGDVDFIEKIVKARITAIVEAYNADVRKKSGGEGKRVILVGAEIALPEGWEEMTMLEAVRWLNDQVGAIPHADAERMSIVEIIAAIKNRISIGGKLDALTATSNAGFKMVLDKEDQIIANQPLTFKAAKEYGAAQCQRQEAKAKNKAARRMIPS